MKRWVIKCKSSYWYKFGLAWTTDIEYASWFESKDKAQHEVDFQGLHVHDIQIIYTTVRE